MTIQDKREELRQRVEASRGRFSPDPVEQEDPVLADRVEDFARQYPLALMGGALLIGILLGFSGKRGDKAAKGAAKIDKKISKMLVDLLFAIGISLLEDVSKSKVFDEDDDDEARAASAASKNKMIRGAAGVAVDTGQKMRETHQASTE
jgi:hypothetical protein